jgi:hypothetical protein
VATIIDLPRQLADWRLGICGGGLRLAFQGWDAGADDREIDPFEHGFLSCRRIDGTNCFSFPRDELEKVLFILDAALGLAAARSDLGDEGGWSVVEAGSEIVVRGPVIAVASAALIPWPAVQLPYAGLRELHDQLADLNQCIRC